MDPMGYDCTENASPEKSLHLTEEQVAARWAPEEVTDSQEGAAPDTETEMMVGGTSQ